MNIRVWIIITAIVLGVAGYALLSAYGGWQIALGVFLCVWANNLQLKHGNS